MAPAAARRRAAPGAVAPSPASSSTLASPPSVSIGAAPGKPPTRPPAGSAPPPLAHQSGKKDRPGRVEAFGLAAARAAARHLVGPLEQPVQVRAGRGRDDPRAAKDNLSTGPVDGDERAFRDGLATGPHGGDVDAEVGGPHHGRPAHRPRDHGGARGRAPTRGDDTPRGGEPGGGGGG